MQSVRRVDIVWQGDEVGDYEAISQQAMSKGMTVSEALKDLGRREFKSG